MDIGTVRFYETVPFKGLGFRPFLAFRVFRSLRV